MLASTFLYTVCHACMHLSPHRCSPTQSHVGSGDKRSTVPFPALLFTAFSVSISALFDSQWLTQKPSSRPSTARHRSGLRSGASHTTDLVHGDSAPINTHQLRRSSRQHRARQIFSPPPHIPLHRQVTVNLPIVHSIAAAMHLILSPIHKQFNRQQIPTTACLHNGCICVQRMSLAILSIVFINVTTLVEWIRCVRTAWHDIGRQNED